LLTLLHTLFLLSLPSADRAILVISSGHSFGQIDDFTIPLVPLGLLWALFHVTEELLEHDVVQVVDYELLLEGDQTLRVQVLRLLEQQLVSFDFVRLQARRQSFVDFDSVIGVIDVVRASFSCCQVWHCLDYALTLFPLELVLAALARALRSQRRLR